MSRRFCTVPCTECMVQQEVIEHMNLLFQQVMDLHIRVALGKRKYVCFCAYPQVAHCGSLSKIKWPLFLCPLIVLLVISSCILVLLFKYRVTLTLPTVNCRRWWSHLWRTCATSKNWAFWVVRSMSKRGAIFWKREWAWVGTRNWTAETKTLFDGVFDPFWSRLHDSRTGVKILPSLSASVSDRSSSLAGSKLSMMGSLLSIF